MIDNTIMPGMMKRCTRLVRVDNGPDGQFGRRNTYRPGASFDALIRKDSTPEAVEAEARTHKERYMSSAYRKYVRRARAFKISFGFTVNIARIIYQKSFCKCPVISKHLVDVHRKFIL